MTDPAKPNQSAEELERPLENTIRKVMEEAKPAPGGYDIYADQCDLNRTSLPDIEMTREQVGRVVEEYCCILDEALQSQEKPVPWDTKLGFGIFISFCPTSTPRDGKFILERGKVAVQTYSRGLILQSSIESINRCIVEKSRNIQDKSCRFPQWWLVLVPVALNTPIVGATDDLQEIRSGLEDTSPWSRIVVVSWQDHPKPGNVYHVDLIRESSPT